MTALQMYKQLLIELHKMHAPAIKLFEFNYFINKAIQTYIDEHYRIYDTTLKTGDDLSTLKSQAFLIPQEADQSTSEGAFGVSYVVELPIDYLHLLNCVCVFNKVAPKPCENGSSKRMVPATRLTADAWALVVDDVYNQPSTRRPYYYIHNVNTGDAPTRPVDESKIQEGSDMTGVYNVNSNGVVIYNYKGEYITQLDRNKYAYVKMLNDKVVFNNDGTALTTSIINDFTDLTLIKLNLESKVVYPTPEETVATIQKQEGSNLPRTFKLNIGNKELIVSLVEKPIGARTGNPNVVRMEIRCGKNAKSAFNLELVQVDYLRTPQHIRLTQQQVDHTLDTSLIMEFLDYVCQEILNKLTMILLEHASDNRLVTFGLMNGTVASSAGNA